MLVISKQQVSQIQKDVSIAYIKKIFLFTATVNLLVVCVGEMQPTSKI
jgi:hypothetical protein